MTKRIGDIGRGGSVRRLACGLAACLTGCEQEPGPPLSCEPVTSEFAVVGVRAQQPGWGEPCVPLFVGDTFRWTRHGSCPDRFAGKDAPEFIRNVAPVCVEPLGPVVCTDVAADAEVDRGTRIAFTLTIQELDLIVEWYQVTDSGEVIECTQQFDVGFVRTIPHPSRE